MTYTRVYLEAYETNKDDFNVLVVYYNGEKRVDHEKLEGYSDIQDAFIAGFKLAFDGEDLDDYTQANFHGNKFKKNYYVN